MKKNEVVIGGQYVAKVSGNLVPVRITGESKYGGWDAVNTKTNKAVRIKSPQRLRRPANEATAKAVASDNPLAKATGSDFADALNKATAEQLSDALNLQCWSAKQRSRIEAALKTRRGLTGSPARTCPKCGSADLTFNKRGFTCAKCGHKQDADDVAKTVEAVTKGDLTKGVEIPTAAHKKPAAKVSKPEGKMSGLDAAAKVLAESPTPLNARQIVEQAAAKGYWTSSAATPHSTIYAAMIVEIAKKGDQARFKKVDRGLFTAAGAGQPKQAK
ncbi:MAG: hypothetical protein BIFFINMI_03790 [Phycisphaerae bacterium]|nr:hypothetical protein [Phycisphaerae bacterium]